MFGCLRFGRVLLRSFLLRSLETHGVGVRIDIDDLEGMYSDVSTEYKRLPGLHDTLWAVFSGVKNRSDLEQYRQVLIPNVEVSEDGSTLPKP